MLRPTLAWWLPCHHGKDQVKTPLLCTCCSTAITLSNNVILEGLPALLRRLDRLSSIILSPSSSIPVPFVSLTLVQASDFGSIDDTFVQLCESRSGWRCTFPSSPPRPGSECQPGSPGGTRRWEGSSNQAQASYGSIAIKGGG